MRVLLVDDHALFRDGMVMLLRGVDDDVEPRHAASLQQALEKLRGEPPFDLVTYDLKLQGTAADSGVEGLRTVLAHAGDAPIVVLSGEERADVVRQCLDAGARGYILKSSDSRVMAAALHLVLSGGYYLPPLALALGEAARGADARIAGLTPRQRDVLNRLAQGKANKAIARELGISDATVKAHVTAIMQHLGTSSRAETVFAMRDVELPHVSAF
jgi:DNA-binding NarL/FixJ family response regulator